MRTAENIPTNPTLNNAYNRKNISNYGCNKEDNGHKGRKG